MPKNLFDSLSPAAAFATKLFATAGLDFTAMLAKGDDTALKLHLESLGTFASAKEAIEQATTKLQGELAAKETELALVTTRHTLLSKAIEAKGVKFAVDADGPAITAALEARLSTLAGEELAKHGLKAFPEQTVAADAAAAAKAAAAPKLTGLARVTAALAAKRSATA